MILADLMQAHREAAAARIIAQINLEHATRLERTGDIDRLLSALDDATRAEETAEQAFNAGASMNECERCGALQTEPLAPVTVHVNQPGFDSLQRLTFHLCAYCSAIDIACELDHGV